MTRTRRRLATLFLGCGLALPAGGPTGATAVGPAATASSPSPPAELRVDSAGYSRHGAKRAWLMTPAPDTGGERYAVVDGHGRHLLDRPVPTRQHGRWSSTYPAVTPLSFTPVRRTGRYRIVVTDGGSTVARSEPFRITTRRRLLDPVVRKGVTFFQTQRDGAHQVGGPLHRMPSHVGDAHAGIYRDPRFADNGDVIRGRRLHRLPGDPTADVAGGWFDAGDYLKFTATASYADIALAISARSLGRRAPAALRTEAAYGERWLRGMWDGQDRRLLLQVGIGTGDRSGRFLGDHDLWRLPQHDAHDHRRRDRYATTDRPVFAANRPGAPISPNLAGRVAASFALAAQREATTRPAAASRSLHAAQAVYRLAAARRPPHPLITALPRSYYPETVWRDDIALGAAELALARLDLHRSSGPWIDRGLGWLRAYEAHDTGDTLNLYDDSALAAADLASAVRRSGGRHAVAERRRLLEVLRRQLAVGRRHADRDPFGLGADEDDFDVDSHTAGLAATAELYDRATGSHRYATFAADQLGWLFGANPWGASFMIGEGRRFPQCIQHQVANLSGTLDGRPPVATGAVVNGPNDARLFAHGLGGYLEGMRRCPGAADRFTPFDGHGSRFVDDVRAWQTDEPALDMTATTVLAAALGG